MAPHPRVVAAYRAMSVIGIGEWRVKPVLKKLLKLYDMNWEFIEQENYRTLADAIFEDDENKVPEQKKKTKKVDEEEMEGDEEQMHVEEARHLKRKRLHLRGQESQPLHPPTNSAPSSATPPLKKPKLEDNTSSESRSRQQSQKIIFSSDGNWRIEALPIPTRDGIVDRGEHPASSQVTGRKRRFMSERASPSGPSKEPKVETGKFLLPNNRMPGIHTLIIPKDEPIDELPDYEVPPPIAVIPPESESVRVSSMKNGAAGKQDGHVTVASSQSRDEGHADENIPPSTNEKVTSNVEIASSTLEEVKISLSCNSALLGPDFQMPNREQLLEMMEAKCLQSYQITDPNFSVVKLLRDVCDCLLELRTGSNDDSQEGSVIRSSADVLKESEAHDRHSEC